MARGRFEHLLVKHEGPVTRIVLARPERRNALSLAVIEELLDALASLPAECAVVVVQAEGPAFSAGHDLSEMLGREDDFYAEIFDACTQLMLAIQERALRNRQFGGVAAWLPALTVTESLLFQLIAAGFALLSLALATGAMFVEDLMGQHLAHKTVFSILAWLVFGALLYGRWRHGWRGLRADGPR